MIALALSSLRWRAGRFVASLVSLFFGATVLMAFASLIDCAGGAGVSAADRSSLTTMALVTGGLALLIVTFGVAATLNLSVRQRDTEIALLRSVGATPAQIARLILVETAALSALAAAVAIPAAMLAGRAVLAALAGTHQLTGVVGYHFGAAALGIGLGDAVLAAAVAASVTAGRAGPRGVRAALAAAASGNPPLGRRRAIAGTGFLVLGASCAVLTGTVLSDRGFLTQALAGEACGHTSIGLALLAPALMRLSAALCGRVLPGASGYLAGINVRQRTSQTAGVLMPIILLTGLAGGSLYVQALQNAANRTAHIVRADDEKGVETVGLIVVAMIAVFAAVVLINMAITTAAHRRREFGQQRLIGATPGQVLRMVGLETAVTVVTGVAGGTVGLLAGVVPYRIALAHRAAPDAGPAWYLGVVATAALLAFAANLGASRWAIGRPARDAVALDT